MAASIGCVRRLVLFLEIFMAAVVFSAALDQVVVTHLVGAKAILALLWLLLVLRRLASTAQLLSIQLVLFSQSH